MVFTYVRWERGFVAGVAAYVAGYLAVYSLPAPVVARALRTEGTTRLGDPLPPLIASVPDGAPAWKLVGWVWHGALLSPVATHYSGSISTVYVNPIVGVADTHASLYAVGPVLLALAGCVVVLVSWTPGERCELYSGAATVLGFALACFVGGLLFTVDYPADGPDLLTSVFRAGLFYPLAFGGIGGLLGRRLKALAGVTYATPPDDLWEYDNRRTGERRRW